MPLDGGGRDALRPLEQRLAALVPDDRPGCGRAAGCPGIARWAADRSCSSAVRRCSIVRIRSCRKAKSDGPGEVVGAPVGETVAGPHDREALPDGLAALPVPASYSNKELGVDVRLTRRGGRLILRVVANHECGGSARVAAGVGQHPNRREGLWP